MKQKTLIGILIIIFSLVAMRFNKNFSIEHPFSMTHMINDFKVGYFDMSDSLYIIFYAVFIGALVGLLIRFFRGRL